MARVVGLRTEILVNLSLLLGAALLFSGFLLLKLTEQELVNQRIESAKGTIAALSRGLSVGNDTLGSPAGIMASQARVALMSLSGPSGIESWILFDPDLQAIASYEPEAMAGTGAMDRDRARFFSEPEVRVDYVSAWFPFRDLSPGFLVVTAPVHVQGEYAGGLQARFTLKKVHERIRVAQGFVLLYVAFYGGVLILFGVYLLGRNVVSPIRQLRQLTREVAGGNLEQTLQASGPREIAELGGAFNAMVEALRTSRAETEFHIRSLEKTNGQLLQTRDELIRSEKMASVGHLSAGMAHEIGNPLGAIIGYLELLKSDLADGGHRDLVERSLSEVGRIDRLVRELLDFAAPSPKTVEVFDPVEVGRGAMELLSNQGVFDMRTLCDALPDTLPPVAMVRHRLQQVLVNLLINARDATRPDDTIGIAGGEAENGVWLSVHDSGAGMRPEVVSRIFDPFFTTKATGQGRGLGLAICQRAVEEAGGRLEVRSGPGSGSEFKIWLKPAGAQEIEKDTE